MSDRMTATKLLMCAAHLYPDELYNDIKERFEHPYKASTPEFGIDIAKIRKELDKSREQRKVKSVFLFVVVLLVFPLFLQNMENLNVLYIALFLASTAEFICLRSSKTKVRNMLNTDMQEDTDDITSDNVVVSGGYSPFSGAGFDLDSWSFCVDLNKRENEGAPLKEIKIDDLYKSIELSIQQLKIEGVVIKDQLFVDGRDLSLLPHLLSNGPLSRPICSVDKGYISSKINQNDPRERHYKVIHIGMWNFQVLLSMYFRFYSINNNLFIEGRFFLLPPLKEKFLNITNIPAKTTTEEFIVQQFSVNPYNSPSVRF